MTFSVNIELGNQAMEQPEDVADALDHIAAKLREGYTSGPVMDENGNTVGSWDLA